MLYLYNTYNKLLLIFIIYKYLHKLHILGWNELLIAAFSHRSIGSEDGILLATGLHVRRAAAHEAGVGTIFDRVLEELVAKMRDMKMDKSELGCLRAIILFNPGRLLTCCRVNQMVVSQLFVYLRWPKLLHLCWF